VDRDPRLDPDKAPTAPDSIAVVAFEGRSTNPPDARALADCRAIRRAVFIDEQEVPESLEWDGLDAEAHHFLARAVPAREAPTRGPADPIGRAIGTARMRIVDGHAKAERVAVLASARRLGVGRELMLALEVHARAQRLPSVVLHAQVRAIPFYERLGYRAHGPVFLDAGIDHRAMTKALD